MEPIDKRISPIEASWAGRAVFKVMFSCIIRDYFAKYGCEQINKRLDEIYRKKEERRLKNAFKVIRRDARRHYDIS